MALTEKSTGLLTRIDIALRETPKLSTRDLAERMMQERIHPALHEALDSVAE